MYNSKFLLCILQTMRKTWPGKCARKKIFKNTFRVSSQISVDLQIYLYYKNISPLLRPPPPCHIKGAGVKSDFAPAGRKEKLYSRRAWSEHFTRYDENYYFIVWVNHVVVSFECVKLNFPHSMCITCRRTSRILWSKYNFKNRK